MVGFRILGPRNQRKLNYLAQCRWRSLHLEYKKLLGRKLSRPLSLPLTPSLTPTWPGILGNRQLPWLSLQNLMALLSVLKPSRDLITEHRREECEGCKKLWKSASAPILENFK